MAPEKANQVLWAEERGWLGPNYTGNTFEIEFAGLYTATEARDFQRKAREYKPRLVFKCLDEVVGEVARLDERRKELKAFLARIEKLAPGRR